MADEKYQLLRESSDCEDFAIKDEQSTGFSRLAWLLIGVVTTTLLASVTVNAVLLYKLAQPGIVLTNNDRRTPYGEHS